MKPDYTLYAITERSLVGRQSLYEQVEAALRGGAGIIQLREKNISEQEFIDEALKLKEICHGYNVPLIINDNLDVALKSGADGVHVGAEDMPVSEIRRIAGDNFIIGATAKTVEQAVKAEKDGADYLGSGAVFPSPTKKNALRITPELLKQICTAVKIPVVAIGGITLENMDEVKNCNVSGIAVVSAVFGADDIEKATKQLKQKADSIINQC